jgi:glycosyltransferase involved in cell wall biosynthesis
MRPAVQALARDDESVVVTGRVADVRPYLRHAAVVVAPLRLARGVQNKALEAMAMARPLVLSPACAQALAGEAGSEFEVAEDAAGFADKILALCGSPRGLAMGQAARQRVLKDYRWDDNLAPIQAVLSTRRKMRAPPAPAESRKSSAAI